MVWWGICTRLYYKFPTEFNSERILKIGQYLVKLWARVRCLVFLTHGVVLRPDMEAKYCDERVCVSVCLSLRQRNLRNHASSLRRVVSCTLPMAVAGSVLLWWRCDILCIHRLHTNLYSAKNRENESEALAQDD